MTNEAKHHPKPLGLPLNIPADTKTYRTSLSLPADLAVNLNLLSKRMGITQSALVAALLSEALPSLSRLLDAVPETDDPDSIRRFRGKSVEIVLDQVRELLKAY